MTILVQQQLISLVIRMLEVEICLHSTHSLIPLDELPHLQVCQIRRHSFIDEYRSRLDMLEDVVDVGEVLILIGPEWTEEERWFDSTEADIDPWADFPLGSDAADPVECQVGEGDVEFGEIADGGSDLFGGEVVAKRGIMGISVHALNEEVVERSS